GWGAAGLLNPAQGGEQEHSLYDSSYAQEFPLRISSLHLNHFRLEKPIRQANALHKHIVFLAGEVMFDCCCSCWWRLIGNVSALSSIILTGLHPSTTTY